MEFLLSSCKRLCAVYFGIRDQNIRHEIQTNERFTLNYRTRSRFSNNLWNVSLKVIVVVLLYFQVVNSGREAHESDGVHKSQRRGGR